VPLCNYLIVILQGSLFSVHWQLSAPHSFIDNRSQLSLDLPRFACRGSISMWLLARHSLGSCLDYITQLLMASKCSITLCASHPHPSEWPIPFPVPVLINVVIVVTWRLRDMLTRDKCGACLSILRLSLVPNCSPIHVMVRWGRLAWQQTLSAIC